MFVFKPLGAAAMLAAISLTPAQAQAVMQEPGYCAQFYPGANCQNKGPGNPYTDPNYHRYNNPSSGQWASGMAQTRHTRARSARTTYYP